MMGGAEHLAAPRGTDLRLLDLGDRPTRSQKRQEQQDRRDAKAAARAELESERKAGMWTELSNRGTVEAKVIESELAAESVSDDEDATQG